MKNIPTLVSIDWHGFHPNFDHICDLIHKKHPQRSYRGDLKYRVTLTSIFSGTVGSPYTLNGNLFVYLYKKNTKITKREVCGPNAQREYITKESCSCLPASHWGSEGHRMRIFQGLVYPLVKSHVQLEVLVQVHSQLHSSLPNITPTATKVHVMLRRFAALTWMRDNRELMQHVILRNNIKVNLQ